MKGIALLHRGISLLFLLASELLLRASALNATIFWSSSLHSLKTPVIPCCSTLRKYHYLSALNLPSSAMASSTYSLELKLPFYFPVFGCYGYVVYFKEQPSNQNSRPENGLRQEQYHLLQNRTSIYSCCPMTSCPGHLINLYQSRCLDKVAQKQKLHSLTMEGLNYNLREQMTCCVPLKFHVMAHVLVQNNSDKCLSPI